MPAGVPVPVSVSAFRGSPGFQARHGIEARIHAQAFAYSFIPEDFEKTLRRLCRIGVGAKTANFYSVQYRKEYIYIFFSYMYRIILFLRITYWIGVVGNAQD